MGGVNQGWSLDQAKMMEKRVEDLGLNWLEEPIDAEDMEGYAELSRYLEVPITTGENLYTITPFHRFLKHKSASVYMPDLQRIGGVTGWKRLVTLFETNLVHFSMHLFPEMASHLFKEPLECRNGVVRVPDRPGFGIEWDQEKIERHIV